MTYEEAKKFLMNVITYPQKPNGDSKYPNYWIAEFIEVLALLDEQAEVLRILKKFGYFACEVHENHETKRHLHVCKNGEFATIEITEEELETITKWIEGKVKWTKAKSRYKP